ncbi:MAG: DUF4349 domain-containing protein [Chloroflexi bacterium]|nr:DUF4349 domain-containing protein [Chloroflexota bacterium]
MRRIDTLWRAFHARYRLLAVIAVVAILAACSQGSAGSGGGGADLDSGPGRGVVDEEALDEARAGDGEVATGGGPEAPEPNALPAEQRIIKTGEMAIEVERVASALARVRALAVDLGGYVGDSQAGTLDQSATVTLRIPASRFGDALIELRELDGEVISEATREQDVTRQIVDLEARIANLEASEASYRILLERADRIDDVLAVQSRLDEVRGQIEQHKAQLENLTGQADLSTLTVTLIPSPQPIADQSETWDPGAELNHAIASLVAMGQGLANGLIWFVIVWMPILLVLAVLGLVALRGVLELRRRVPVAAGRDGSGS